MKMRMGLDQSGKENLTESIDIYRNLQLYNPNPGFLWQDLS